MIAKFAMKAETSKGEFLEFTSWLDRHGKLISDAERTETGRFMAVACFDSRADYLAFLVHIGFFRLVDGLAELEPKTEEETE